MLDGKSWYRMDGASAQTIRALRDAAPADLPEGYVKLLSTSNGGEGPLLINPFNLCLDPAEEVIARLTGTNYGQRAFDGFLIFGGNGGGEFVAFDTRQGAPWPVVTIDMVAGQETAELVASNFDKFIDLIGIEPTED